MLCIFDLFVFTTVFIYQDIYGRSRDVNVVLYLRADFQHKFRFNLILPLVCYVGGSLKNGLVLTYIQAL